MRTAARSWTWLRTGGRIVLPWLVLTALTCARYQEWQSDRAIWESAARVAPTRGRVLVNLGRALGRDGDWPGAKAAFDAAWVTAHDSRQPAPLRAHRIALAGANSVLARRMLGDVDGADARLRMLQTDAPDERLTWTVTDAWGVLLPTPDDGFVFEDMTDASVRGLWRGWRAELPRSWPHPRWLTTLTMRRQGGQSAAAYRAVNGSLHVMNACLLAVLAGPWLALLWAVHPFNVETWAYVSARTDLLMAAAVLAVLLAARGRGAWALAGVTLAGLLALLAKESGIVILALYPLWLWRRRVVSWRRWLWPSAVWGLAGAYAAWQVLPGLSRWTSPAPFGPMRFAASQLAAVGWLLAHLLVPVGFSIDHDWDRLGLGLACVAAVVALLLVAGAWRVRSTRPSLAFAVAWVLLAVLPRLVVPLPDLISEHQLYVPVLGLVLAVGGRA